MDKRTGELADRQIDRQTNSKLASQPASQTDRHIDVSHPLCFVPFNVYISDM